MPPILAAEDSASSSILRSTTPSNDNTTGKGFLAAEPPSPPASSTYVGSDDTLASPTSSITSHYTTRQKTDNGSQSQSNSSSVLHKHRLNNSASKLPAFRFADLKKDMLVLPSRPHRMPPSPVSLPSLSPGAQEQEQSGQAQMHSAPSAVTNATANAPPATTRRRYSAGTDNTENANNGNGPNSANGSFLPKSKSHAHGHAHSLSDPTSLPAPTTAAAPATSSAASTASSPATVVTTGTVAPFTTTPTTTSTSTTGSRATFQNPVPTPASPDSPKSPKSHQKENQNSSPNPKHTSSSSSSSSTAITASSSVTAATSTSATTTTSTTSTVSSSSFSPSFSTSSFTTPPFTTSSTLTTFGSSSSAIASSAGLTHNNDSHDSYDPSSSFYSTASPPKVVVSTPSANTTVPLSLHSPSPTPASPRETRGSPGSPTSASSPTPGTTKLQRTLTDPSPSKKKTSLHRRATASFGSNEFGSNDFETLSPVKSNFETQANTQQSTEKNTSNPTPTHTVTADDDDLAASVATSADPPSPDASTKEWAKGQCDLVLTTSSKTGKPKTKSTSLDTLDTQKSASETSTPRTLTTRRSLPNQLQQQPQQSQPSQQQSLLTADDKRKTSTRPPLSFRAPRNEAPTSRPVIPPIRSFRSSGSRKSLGLQDMNFRSPGGGGASTFEDADNTADGGVLDSRQRDRTLRALEGRNTVGDDDFSQHGGAHIPRRGADPDTTGDIFMRIARDDRQSDDPSIVSRVSRTASQRRPFSAAVPSRQNTSPPQIIRRLSDQRETATARQRRYAEEQALQQQQQQQQQHQQQQQLQQQQQQQVAIARDTPPRALASDRTTPLRSATTSQRPDPIRTRTVISSTRPSPSTPRTSVFYDTASEVGTNYSRRRPSMTESISSGAPLPLRTSSIKTSHNYARTYNSSPLVPRHTDVQHEIGGSHAGLGIGGMDSTESTASTAAPSTVWDELDELKSRMRRLELTGKIPPTSGAAMSRASDERPRTATTSATTISGSPKRVATNGQAADVRSTTSSQLQQQQQQLQQQSLQSPQQGNQPVLLSALRGVKPHVSDDVYGAIETAATEALALSQMVGVVGQPGPISSGASTIGTNMPSTVTDRQLRRKAESICRSLTELCLTLNDEAAHRKAKEAAAAATAQIQANLPQSQTQQQLHLQQQEQQRQQLQLQQQQKQQDEQQQQREQLQQQLQQQQDDLQQRQQRLHQQQQEIRQHQAQRASRDDTVTIASPTTTTNKAFASLANSRRGVVMEPASTAPKLQTSPRAPTRYEDRRTSFLSTPTLPSPRFALGPPVSSENAGRRSSLMISRTRRAASEEPEEMPQSTGRRSSLLRTRRAGTEEPESAAAGEGRKTSLLYRSRRTIAQANNDEGSAEDDMEGRQVRSPSRAFTEVAGLRGAPREYQPREYQPREYPSRDYASQMQQQQQQSPAANNNAASVSSNANVIQSVEVNNSSHPPLASSALPRRRLVPSSLNSRLVTPQTTTTAMTASSPLLSSRRFLERSSQQQQEREGGSAVGTAGTLADKYAEDRMQRHVSLGQTSLLNRTNSVSRRRDSALPSLSSASSQVGGYR
ncbi:hypothetical protein Sste5346_008943 [Sporothrix stenoceras]|uniref:LPXTG-motif cell wall anchor domain protein n=1 Tax=Sporothrix stenoceras TaxID=5173 RepID=A0ABR3YNF2_9PEZI